MEENINNPAVNNPSPASAPQPVKPQNYLWLAIFCTVCCCLPLGIVGIIKASKVNSLYASKQYTEAAVAAGEAKKWSLIGIVVGAIFSIIYAVFYGATIMSELH